MRNPWPRERRFIETLNELVARQERGALAALRRGLGKPPGSVAEMHRYVAPWPPEEDDPFAPWVQRRQDAWYLVAALFALHQVDYWRGMDTSRRYNLGWSFRRLASTQESDSVEKRFTALLNSHTDDLPAHLQASVSLLAEVPINWAQLLADIQEWGDDDRSVQRGWAQAFWGSRGSRDEDENEPSASDTETSDEPVLAG
jgi:CRISPR system Cascade subunit CasB